VDAPAEEAKDLGVVRTNVKAGSAVLHGPKGDVTLVWTARDEDRRRMLPPGAYRLRTARVEREKDGVHWFLSATAPPKEAARELKAGRKLRLDVGATVHFKGQVRRRGDALQLGFSVKDGEGRGLSVYRAGKRVAVTYKVLSKRGKVLAEGTMNYG
jgi:hypothetical protein